MGNKLSSPIESFTVIAGLLLIPLIFIPVVGMPDLNMFGEIGVGFLSGFLLGTFKRKSSPDNITSFFANIGVFLALIFFLTSEWFILLTAQITGFAFSLKIVERNFIRDLDFR